MHLLLGQVECDRCDDPNVLLDLVRVAVGLTDVPDIESALPGVPNATDFDTGVRGKLVRGKPCIGRRFFEHLWFDVIEPCEIVGRRARRAGDTPDNTRETLRTYDLETRTVEQFAITGGWESGALEVSVGGSNVATYWSSEAATGFAFHSESGELIGFPGNPYESEQFCGDGQLYDGASGQSVDLPCYEFAELSDDGRLAYYEAGFNGIEVRWILVVVDLESGKELFRQDVNRPDQGWKPNTIDLSANMALVNRTGTGAWGAPFIDALLVDLNSGTFTEVGLSGQARFLTGPMGIS